MVYNGRDPFAPTGITEALLDTWILEALQLYRVAKHQEDKELLRSHIMDCQIAMTMLATPGSPTSPTSPKSPTSPAKRSSPTSSPTKKDKQD